MPDSATGERADSPSSLTPESYGSFGDRGDDICPVGFTDSFTPRKPSIGRDISARGSKKKNEIKLRKCVLAGHAAQDVQKDKVVVSADANLHHIEARVEIEKVRIVHLV